MAATTEPTPDLEGPAKPKGYLVFTTHDKDEVDATFVPETEEGILKALNGISSPAKPGEDDALMKRWSEWQQEQESKGIEPLFWHTQTRCKFPWPFNNHDILGTFYLLVY